MQLQLLLAVCAHVIAPRNSCAAATLPHHLGWLSASRPWQCQAAASCSADVLTKDQPSRQARWLFSVALLLTAPTHPPPSSSMCGAGQTEGVL